MDWLSVAQGSLTLRAQIERFIRSRFILGSVFIVSILESTVLPVALEILLLPLMQSRRSKMWHIAAAATLGCVIGAVLGYFLGAWLLDISRPLLLDLLGGEANFQHLQEKIKAEGFWFILLAGITPIPLQFAMLAAGATHYPLGAYILAIALSRTMRYFGLAVLTFYVGDHAESLISRYKKPVCWALLLLLVLFIFYKITF